MRRGVAALVCAVVLVGAGAWWWSSRSSATTPSEAYANSERVCRAMEARLLKSTPVVHTGSDPNQITVDVPGISGVFKHYDNARTRAASRAGCRAGLRLAGG